MKHSGSIDESVNAAQDTSAQVALEKNCSCVCPTLETRAFEAAYRAHLKNYRDLTTEPIQRQ